MELSKETLTILKNFASINPNLLVKQGSVLNTMNAQKTIFARATLKEDFPVEFGIYDLSEFLGALALFDGAPDLRFEDKYVRMETAESSVKFYYAEPATLVYPQKSINFPGADVEFTVKDQDFQRILRASATLSRAPDVAFASDGGGSVSALVADKNNPTSNVFHLDLGQATDKLEFRAYVKIDNMKMIPGEYRVAFSKRKISHFVSADGKLEYFVALETDSKFE